MQTITKDQHLQALGLFTLVVQHARQAEAARQGLARLLGRDAKQLGGIDDAMFDDRNQTPQHLDEALKAEGIAIADE